MASTLIWADIPVTDMTRAARFYSELLMVSMEGMPGLEDSVAVPSGNAEGDVSFDLAKAPGLEPGAGGARIYFDPKGDIEGMIARGIAAGGSVVQPPMDMGPVVGVIAMLKDTEGNVIGLRQPSAAAL